MRFLIFFFLSAGTLSGNAQQYLIKHDLQSQKTAYYKIEQKDTVRVKNLHLKKNARIFLQVENYNPFYWNAKVTAFKTPVQEEVGFAQAFNPISVLAGGFKDILGSFPLLDLPKSRGTLDLNDPKERFISTATQYAESYNKLQELNEKYDQLQVTELQLKDLKHDFTKTEQEIKAEAQAAVLRVLGTERLDLTNSINLAKQYNQQLTAALQTVSSLNNQLQQQIVTVNGTEEYEGTTLKDVANKATTSFSNVAKLKQLQDKNANFFLEEVVSVAALYREITNTNFHFSYAINSGADLSDLKLEIYPKESGSKDTVVQYFQLEGRNNIRIRNSVGIAFTYFNANNTKYYIDENGMIQTGDKDLFNPLLSTLLHFYSGRAAGVKLGGAFGFGIPVQGEKKDINFLLGATAGFGQNEPILVSAGFSGAKVNKLMNGYKVGQKTSETDPEKLTTSGYDIGGFLSITFNMSNLNIGRK